MIVSRVLLTKKMLATALLIAAMSLMTLLALPSAASAAEPGDEFNGELCGGASLSLNTDQCNNPCTERETDGTCTAREESHADSKVNGVIKTIVNILTTIVGLVAVVMIIIGGFKYVTAGGDAGKLTGARNTILYSIVGLIIVALAQVLVRFVLAKATKE